MSLWGWGVAEPHSTYTHPLLFPSGTCLVSNCSPYGLHRACPPPHGHRNAPSPDPYHSEQHPPSFANESQPQDFRLKLSGKRGFSPLSLPSWSEVCWKHRMRRVCLRTMLRQGQVKQETKNPGDFIWALDPTAPEAKCVRSSVMSGSAIPWTDACQAPLSMRFPRQECWSGLPLPSLGDVARYSFQFFS